MPNPKDVRIAELEAQLEKLNAAAPAAAIPRGPVE
jgi:hypothetical protein